VHVIEAQNKQCEFVNEKQAEAATLLLCVGAAPSTSCHGALRHMSTGGNFDTEKLAEGETNWKE
jgi:hypothetical protein